MYMLFFLSNNFFLIEWVIYQDFVAVFHQILAQSIDLFLSNILLMLDENFILLGIIDDSNSMLMT